MSKCICCKEETVGQTTIHMIVVPVCGRCYLDNDQESLSKFVKNKTKSIDHRAMGMPPMGS